MASFVYNCLRFFFTLLTGLFFREIKVCGVNHVPLSKPCIFIVAPHANQFIDPGLVIISNPRSFSPLMAQASFKRKIIGIFARLLKAIPVTRSQDLVIKGTGKLIFSNKRVLNGQFTRFSHEISPGDHLLLSKKISIRVDQVLSDTQLKLKEELSEEAIFKLIQSGQFKIMPRVDQMVLFEKVNERLKLGECLVIFPEGGSHDRSEMLPLKAGFAMMALGAMAENEDLDLKIIPIGLNYFHPHRFRSRAVVSYGPPVLIRPEWIQAYQKGGQAKREAVALLLEAGYHGLKGVTINAPNHNMLTTIATARRLYKSKHKLTIDQVVDLNRRFLLGYKHFENDPGLLDLTERVKAYSNTLKYYGLCDHQVIKTQIPFSAAFLVLIFRLFKLFFLCLVGFPSLLIHSPLLILVLILSQKKQEEALVGSSVKIEARDVLATWKILITSIGILALYGLYSLIVFVYFSYHGYDHGLSLALSIWVLLPVQYMCVLVIENMVDIYKSLKPLYMSLSNPDGSFELWQMRNHLSEIVTQFVQEKNKSRAF